MSEALFANERIDVVRPSYIIGAVRDNILNYLPGFAVFASVQAHLKKPIAYPGDYLSWDREHCQSSAMINAYLEEWAVLTPDAANEAFNVQDGSVHHKTLTFGTWR